MSRFLIVATGGAGGDLQPLIAAAMAVRGHGHDTVFIGDASVAQSLQGLDIDVRQLPAEVDLRLGLAQIAGATLVLWAWQDAAV